MSDSDRAAKLRNESEHSPLGKAGVRECAELLHSDQSQAREHAAVALRETAAGDPSAVVPALDDLETLFDEYYDDVRRPAVAAIANVAEGSPDAVEPLTERLVARFYDDDKWVRGSAARTLHAIAEDNPEAVTEYIRDLWTLLDDHGFALGHAAGTLGTVAGHDANAVTPTVGRLAAALDHGKEWVRENALFALGQVAATAPGAVETAVWDIARHLDEEPGGAIALEEVADLYPETVTPVADSLVDALDDDNGWTRAHAASALGNVAEADPDAVEPAVESLGELLESEHEPIRAGALYALERLGSQRPDAVRAYTETYRDALDHDEVLFRERAAALLGHLGDETARDALQDLTDDPDEDVREAAGEAIERIDG